MSDKYLEEANSLFPYTQQLRRDFHQYPELGFKEERSENIICGELRKFGISYQDRVANTGVVGLLEGKQEGRTILLRFDMDALPVTEETGVDYASRNAGVMHACGHDGHMAIGLTVARMLATRRDQINGTVKFIFQPAEEGMGGAEQMIAAGILQNPIPEISLAVHVWNEKPLGWFGLADGPEMAGAEIFSIRVIGKGGHGALPQSAVDPVLAAAHIVTSLQTIVSRNVPPLESAVVSVTQIIAGETFNVIPPHAEIGGTIRTFDKATREVVLERFESIVVKTAEALGCRAEITLTQLTPALVNNPAITNEVETCLLEMIPQADVDRNFRTMGSEDMAFILDRIPGCFIFVGSANKERGLNYGHHHPKFDFDEHCLSLAAALLTKTTLRFLEKHSAG